MSKPPLAAKGFVEYQRRAAKTVHGKKGIKGQIASILGLGTETGSILDSSKRYFRDSIDLSLNREFLRIALGDLLWYVAVVAASFDLGMAQIANVNIAKARSRYRSKHPGGATKIGRVVPPEMIPQSSISKEFSQYQFEASKVSELNLHGPDSLIAPLYGLSGATGVILNFLKDHSGPANPQVIGKFFLIELGDLLWYLSAVATVSNLNLGDIAEENLARAQDLYPAKSLPELFKKLPRLDNPKKPTECFPRRMVVRFEEQTSRQGHPIATQTIISADPNAFPKGPVKRRGKFQGFAIGKPLGAKTDDNSRRADGYRYHDAIHMAFMAVLGWSPTVRALLRVKRKSDTNADRTEDGARAIFTDEGLSAVLARFAPRCMGFQGENAVNGDIIDMARALVHDTEIQSLPGWLWRRAISQGFVAMHELDLNQGGFLLADLDARTLTYSKVKPDVTVKGRHTGTTRSKG